MSVIVIEDTDIVKRARVYDLHESILASKFPMSVDVESLNDSITTTAKKLGSSAKGEGHDQFLTGITVSFDLTLSNKAWVEAERYRFFYFVSSQSTMHRITKFDLDNQFNDYVTENTKNEMKRLVAEYNANPSAENYLRVLYNNPAGFKITARMTTNYRELKTIYAQRKNHRLPEWREFCAWIEQLPHFKELCLGEE